MDDLNTGGGAAAVPDASSSSSGSAPDVRGETAAVARELSGETPQPDAPPSGDPSSPSPTPTGSATGTDDEEVDAATLATGAVPTSRHKAVVTNVRNKERARVEAEWKAKLEPLSWATSVDPARAQRALQFYAGLESMQHDKALAVQYIASQLGVTAKELRGEVASGEDADPMPPPDIPLSDGTAVYSAQVLQQLLQWHGRQMTKQVDEQYGPVKQRAILADLKVQASDYSKSILDECRQNTAEWPMFTELELEMKALMVRDPNLSLDAAYRRAHNGPNGWRKRQAETQQAAEQDRASQLSRKAAASQPVNPAAPRPVTPRSDVDKSVREIAAEVLASMSQ